MWEKLHCQGHENMNNPTDGKQFLSNDMNKLIILLLDYGAKILQDTHRPHDFTCALYGIICRSVNYLRSLRMNGLCVPLLRC